MAARFATKTDMVKRLTPLRLQALSGGDDQVIDDCIDRAANLVESYLSGNNTPTYAELDQVGQDQVRDVTVDITSYFLAERLGSLSAELVEQRLNAIKWLLSVARGEASFGQQGVRVDAPVISIGSAPRVFTAESMRWW